MLRIAQLYIDAGCDVGENSNQMMKLPVPRIHCHILHQHIDVEADNGRLIAVGDMKWHRLDAVFFIGLLLIQAIDNLILAPPTISSSQNRPNS